MITTDVLVPWVFWLDGSECSLTMNARWTGEPALKGRGRVLTAPTRTYHSENGHK
jgi:hypothetical protein